MKKKTTCLLVMAALVAAVQPALAQSPQSNCDRVIKAAEKAKTDEKDRLADLEQQTKAKIDAAQLCLEAFAAAAAKLTVLAPGIDLGPVQNIMAQAACSVIQRQANTIVSNVPSISTTSSIPSASSIGQTGSSSTPGFWQNLANKILGG